MANHALSLILSLALAACFLGATSQEDYRVHYSQCKAGEQISASATGTEAFDRIMNVSRKKALFFVSPEDCFTCVESVRSWITFLDAYPQVEKALVLSGASQQMADRIKEEHQFALPCIGDAELQLSERFRLSASPVIFFLNEENRLLDFDKCGGSLLDFAQADQLLWSFHGLQKERDIGLIRGEDAYTIGTIRAVYHDPAQDQFYAIDKTFKSVVRFTETGEVLGIVDRHTPGYGVVQPLKSVFRQAGPEAVEILMYDYPGMGIGRVHSFKFHKDPEKAPETSYMKVTVPAGFRIYSTPVDLRDEVLLPAVPQPELWQDSLAIARFCPVASAPVSMGAVAPLTQDSAYWFENLFQQCFTRQDSLVMDPASNMALVPALVKLESAPFGLYYAGMNQLVTFDEHKVPRDTLTLGLHDFAPSDCAADRLQSYVMNIVERDQRLWVLYKKNLFTTDSGPQILARDYYFQVFDLHGNALSQAVLLPPQVVPGKIPPVFTFTDDNTLCFVTKKAGNYQFSIYSIH